jgi:Pvc16 N-terminal domain
MASYAAIAATCEAVVRLLRSNYDPALFGGAALDFQVYVAHDFGAPMEEGVSIFLYRVYQNGNNRTPAGRLLPDGSRQSTKLPIDLHFLLTAWAQKASLQNEIAGWMMRVMEDNSTLPASILNAYQPDVFQPDEAVDITLTELSVEDMFRVWEVMIGHVYQLSVPYQARMIEIDSFASMPTVGGLIQGRVSDMRRVEA